MTVTARDSLNDTISGYVGTVQFSSTDTQAVLPNNYSFTTGINGDNGVHGFSSSVILKTAGSQNISVKDTTTTTATGTSAPVAVSASSATKLAIITTDVSGSTSSTANLGPITVEEQDQYGNAVTVSSNTTVTLSKQAGTGTVVFATSQFGTSVSSITISANTTKASFYVGDSSVESPTISAAVSGIGSVMQTESATTAPAGLTVTGATMSGSSPSLSCGTPSSDVVTCTASGTGVQPSGNNGTITAKVEFVNTTGTAVTYSTTQSSTLGLAITSPQGAVSPSTLTVASGTTTSSGTFTVTNSGGHNSVCKVTFGPYTLTINVNN